MPVTPPSETEPTSSPNAWNLKHWSLRTRRRVAAAILAAILLCMGLVWLSGFAADAIQKRRVQARIDALAARGETLNVSDLAPRQIPPGQNAAVALASVFRFMEDLERGHRAEAARHFKETGQTSRARANAYEQFVSCYCVEAFLRNEAELRARLKEYAAPLRVSQDALARPGSRFPIAYEKGLEVEFPHLKHLRSLGRMYALQAIATSANGESAGIATSVEQIIKLAQTLEGEPHLVSHLVRARVDRIAVRVTQGLVHEGMIAPNDLRSHSDLFAHEANRLDIRLALQGERAAFFHAVDQTFLKSADVKSRPSLRAAYRQVQIAILDEMSIAIDGAAVSYPRATEALESWQRPRQVTSALAKLAETAVGFLPRSLRRTAETRSLLRIAAIACRLAAENAEGTGVLQSWAHIAPPLRTDPFTEQDLLLKQTDDALVIYSVGPNMRDDGGVNEGPNPKGSPDIKDDIAFTIPLRTPAAS